jgi:membrane protease subunit (stomatin/prohibitin family)
MLTFLRQLVFADRSRRDAIRAERQAQRLARWREQDAQRHLSGRPDAPDRCPDCRGSGTCFACGGRTAWAADGREVLCPACGGTNRCGVCGGSGLT